MIQGLKKEKKYRCENQERSVEINSISIFDRMKNILLPTVHPQRDHFQEHDAVFHGDT